MRSELREFLRSSVREALAPVAKTRACKICEGVSPLFGSVDFSKNCERALIPSYGAAVNYYQCSACDFLFTDFCDDWDSADYSEFIYNESYIAVDPEYDGRRGIRTAQHMLPLLENVGRHLSVLDFGAGNGSFADTIRDAGFARVANYDPYAGGATPEGQFDIVTAFEVVEHSATPLQTFDTLLSYMKPGGCVFVGQSMIPDNIRELRTDWWYIAPRNGHISFYSYRTIAKYAALRNLTYRNVSGAFILHGPEISDDTRRFIEHHPPLPEIRIFESLEVAEEALGWHRGENNEGGEFRWTSRHIVSLGDMDFNACETFVSLPVVMVIDESFWNRSMLQIGAMEVPLRRLGNSLCAQFLPSAAGVEHVALVTPEPIRPADRGNSSDLRILGMALRTKTISSL